MLQAFGLSYEPSPLVGPLFQNLTLSIARGEKIALTGPNGAGKTKLLEILAGRLRPNKGNVVLSRGTHIGYLPQDFDFDFGGTTLELCLREASAVGPLAEPKARKLAARLGLREALLAQPYSSLSLGERMRAALVSLLIGEPSILLLDEPTNHLDIGARQWLQNYLPRCHSGLLMVCHDRAMVNKVASRVLELTRGELTEYAGGYDDMVRAKAERHSREFEAWDRSIQEERRLRNAAEKTLQHAASMSKKPSKGTYDPFHKPFYAAKEKALDRRANAIKSRAAKMVSIRVEKPFEADDVSLEFNARPLRRSVALTVRDLSISFGPRVLFDGIDLTLPSRGRVAVVGDNGSGKTTLFRILLGEEVPTQGEVAWDPEARPAYLSQARTRLSRGKSVIQALDPATPKEEKFVRTLLARLRMRGDDVHKRIEDLSVGERTKAELVAILMTPANVLILDEPTNHLDVDSMEAVEAALLTFPGAVLFTSHDRTFVDRVAGHDVCVLRARCSHSGDCG